MSEPTKAEEPVAPPMEPAILFQSVHQMMVAMVMASGRTKLLINPTMLHHVPEFGLSIDVDDKGTIGISITKLEPPKEGEAQ